MGKLLHFGVSRELQSSASVTRRVRDMLRFAALRVLDTLRVPGAIKPCEIDDPVTGNAVRVTVSGAFTVFRINGRDYYFRRVSGRYDGTGMSVECAPEREAEGEG